MKNSSMIFWNVDTQVDFVEPWGKLYVPGAELLKPMWAAITELAAKNDIQVINTADYHYIYSAEIDDHPDMVNTFPPHCLANTKGSDFVAETQPVDPVIFNWNIEYERMSLLLELKACRNIVIRKDAFDVFTGNKVTESLLDLIRPDIVVVYGVTTNVCVDFAVTGLAQKVPNIYVVNDAIKELPGIPLPFLKWESLGVKLISGKELIDSFQEL
jgi:nicotinamidase/pyrazinamidase